MTIDFLLNSEHAAIYNIKDLIYEHTSSWNGWCTFKWIGIQLKAVALYNHTYFHAIQVHVTVMALPLTVTSTIILE